MSVEAKPPVPLRIVAPAMVAMTTGVNAPPGTTSREALLEPLTMREKALVCAVAEALLALRVRAEAENSESVTWADGFLFTPAEKQGILGLLVAFKDATGCKWVDAVWD